jgi:hypothetical protein
VLFADGHVDSLDAEGWGRVQKVVILQNAGPVKSGPGAGGDAGLVIVRPGVQTTVIESTSPAPPPARRR